jgi:hypothetical protein
MLIIFLTIMYISEVPVLVLSHSHDEEKSQVDETASGGKQVEERKVKEPEGKNEPGPLLFL